MKSAYELAMERLSKEAPVKKLSAAQKEEIADLNSQCQAKIAELDLLYQSRLTVAETTGDYEALEMVREELAREKKKFEERFEEKKEAVRNAN